MCRWVVHSFFSFAVPRKSISHQSNLCKWARFWQMKTSGLSLSVRFTAACDQDFSALVDVMYPDPFKDRHHEKPGFHMGPYGAPYFMNLIPSESTAGLVILRCQQRFIWLMCATASCISLWQRYRALGRTIEYVAILFDRAKFFISWSKKGSLGIRKFFILSGINLPCSRLTRLWHSYDIPMTSFTGFYPLQPPWKDGLCAHPEQWQFLGSDRWCLQPRRRSRLPALRRSGHSVWVAWTHDTMIHHVMTM